MKKKWQKAITTNWNNKSKNPDLRSLQKAENTGNRGNDQEVRESSLLMPKKKFTHSFQPFYFFLVLIYYFLNYNSTRFCLFLVFSLFSARPRRDRMGSIRWKGWSFGFCWGLVGLSLRAVRLSSSVFWGFCLCWGVQPERKSWHFWRAGSDCKRLYVGVAIHAAENATDVFFGQNCGFSFELIQEGHRYYYSYFIEQARRQY